MLKTLMLAGDCAVAFAVTWLLNWVALIPFRRSAAGHWTERARILWPARAAAGRMLWLIPANVVLSQRLVWPDAGPPWPLVALAAWLGTVAGTYSFDREMFPWMTPRAWLHQTFATWGLRFFWWFVFLGIIGLMPESLDWQAWALAAVYLGVIALWARGGMVWTWKKLGVLAPAPDRLRDIVTKVSVAMNLPFRDVWLLRSGSGAYALPFTRELVFSERLLERQPDEEIAAVCAHELGHLSESKWTLTTRLLGGIGYVVPWLFIRPVARTWGPAGVFFIVVVSWTTAAWTRLRSRALEVRADAVARTNESEAGVYARALERLYQDCLVPAVMTRKDLTHPDLYDRLLAVGAQPGYPRPEKPESIGWHGYLLTVLAVILAVANMVQFLH